MVQQTTTHEGRCHPSQLACTFLEWILQGSLKKKCKALNYYTYLQQDQKKMLDNCLFISYLLLINIFQNRFRQPDTRIF